VVVLVSAAQAEDRNDPIYDVTLDTGNKLTVDFKDFTKPVVISDEKELAKEVQDEATRKNLTKQVDLAKYNLMIFSWEGSGQDKIEYLVAESFPEQITFSRKLGATDDLRKHVKLFAVRKNVRWKVK
jgi:hypothetical protein